MTIPSRMQGWWTRFGRRQVPVWYPDSPATIAQFETIGKNLKVLKLIPNPFPFYDWIMGFHERPSNRSAMHGPILERLGKIVDVGAGTGYLLSRLVKVTREDQQIVAVDLSSQMLENSRAYLDKHGLLSGRLSFQKADCRALPLPDGAMDLYVSSYLFDLLPESELREAIREMERVLAPDGYAILITMTTELEGAWQPLKLLYRVMNEIYCLGYHKGRWNWAWKFLFAGYAPHCRPIALGRYLREAPNLVLAYTKLSQVAMLPVRIYYVRKSHE